MKKWFLVGLLSGLCFVLLLGAMTQTIQDSGLKPKARWWHGGSGDEAWIWAKEVETIIEAVDLESGNVDLSSGILTLGKTINADVVVTTGTYTVLAANSGKIHVIPDLAGNTSIDLPAEADGLHYKFIYVGAADEAHDHTIDSESDTNFFIGGVAFADTDAGAGADEINAGVYSDGNSNSKLAINNASAGTVVEVFCDGTNWYVTGRVFSDTVPAFADQ